MKQEDLQQITNGLAQGAGEAPNGHNLVGAANAIDGIVEKMDRYGIATVSDLPEDDQQKLADAQEDLQYLNAELGAVLGGMTGDDDTVELPNGKTVDLPGTASSAASSVDLPDVSNGGGN